MAGVSVRMRGASFTEASKRLGDQLGVGFAAAAKFVEADLKRNAFTGKPGPVGLFRGGSTTPGALAAPTGQTRASITSQAFAFDRGKRTQTLAVIGSPVRWLPIHETGGTIRGKPWLAIPTIYASQGGRGKPGFWHETAAGNLLRMTRISKKKYLPTVLLARKVEIPARRMFATSVERTQADVVSIIDAAVRVAVVT